MGLKSGLVQALDDLASSRSSLTRRNRALDALERMLAQICSCRDGKDEIKLEAFMKLQDGFECNIASRLMYSISTWILILRQSPDPAGTERESTDLEVLSTSRSIIQALSILQGIAFLHAPSKDLLGKKWCIQVFIDVLAIYRQLLSTPLSSSTNILTIAASPGTASLASGTIDTLLCVLVDSPAAMRAFEEAGGVEVVVKTLKRTGVARDIRIKCLEFLYFYLLDETGEMSAKHQTVPSQSTPRDPISFPSPGRLYTSNPITPSQSPSTSPSKVPRNLGMLRKDVDFVPVTPKKVQVSRLGVNASRGAQPRTPQDMTSPTKRGRKSPGANSATPTSPTKRRIAPQRSLGELRVDENQEVRRKSTQEKKELLGNWLGNVESLVESVAKSGIWGLG